MRVQIGLFFAYYTLNDIYIYFSSMKIKSFGFFGIVLILPFVGYSQAIDPSRRVVSSAVPFLTISPNSKAAAMGDAGVAATPDANSIFWNTSKLAFIDSKVGGSFSYAPWLRDLVQDMSLLNASGYYKISDKQAITAAITYFNQGEIEFTTNTGASAGRFPSREVVIAAGIAQKLNQDFSMGLNLKYISSNLVGNQVVNGQAGKPGRTAAFDLGIYYNKNRPTDKDTKKLDYAFGLVLQNLGGKVNYGFGEYFIPANLKLGTSITLKPDVHNNFNFLLDFNKLLVPTPDAEGKVPTTGSFPAIFSSLSDAPGGFSEEMKEFMGSLGLEYNYDNIFSLRGGYFFEAVSKGGRKYATMGAGIKLKDTYTLDLAYLIPTNSGNPLANTWRLSLNVALPYKSKGTVKEIEGAE